MKMHLGRGALALLVCLPFATAAQEEEKAESYIYATYFYCDVTKQEDVDALVGKKLAPIYDAAVKDGTIKGWGWLAHHTGGQWRRIQYYVAPSIEALLAAGDALDERIEKAIGDSDEFGEACDGHDDYIWRAVTGSTGTVPAVNRGKAGLSAYHVCDMSRESRADSLMESVLAPVYNAHVAPGMLTSWGWSEHIVGGKYRRLETMTAEDFPSLMRARAAIIDALDGNPAEETFTEICNSHTDYLWEIQHESP